MMYQLRVLAFLLFLGLAPSFAPTRSQAKEDKSSKPVKTTTCNGEKYVYKELAGYGYLPSNARDKTGDTLGGIGSSIALDSTSWQRESNGSYSGIIWALPDRGWNTQGTLNYQNRVQKIKIRLDPKPKATTSKPSGPNVFLEYLDTVLFTDPAGVPTSGLDTDVRPPYLSFNGFPDLPSVTYPGDGFNKSGPGGTRVSVDCEGLFLGHDGSFWVSDEYGPYIYHFDQTGKMIAAIRPPDAYIPLRNGSESFNSDNPPIYNPDLIPEPEDNPTGRDNNHGFEGLTTNPEGTRLYVLLQAGLNQEGGKHNPQDRLARFLIYDIQGVKPKYVAEYAVTLPPIDPSDDDSDVAHQSEIHYISPTQFLVLSRDGDAGRGLDETKSQYRHVDVFDISAATNFKGEDADCFTCRIGDKDGDLNTTITAATYCSWLDFNKNSQLRRFGVHNGGDDDAGLLNEKWESLALAKVKPDNDACDKRGDGDSGDYFLISFSDNDFITQDGYMDSGKLQYSDESGNDLLNQVLVFRVTLPKGSKPLIS
ncbi:3-phytase [Polychaeton citri CBS 116435]|uniref:3-phytase n=1 Tax=Polychaeton citri CBS 116435 TaxID=1314669 RepID=A0A9P4UPH3_9PEZI|nr:3-phytase [Polychaeton citri CBS 116435]